MTTVYNAANEWANAAFRQGRIGFLDIYEVIEDAMNTADVIPHPSVEEILEVQGAINRRCEVKYG